MTMYKDTNHLLNHAESKSAERQQFSTSKVNNICNAFLDALENRTSTNFQNVITAHTCKVPPDLEAGLSQIATLKGEYMINGSMLTC